MLVSVCRRIQRTILKLFTFNLELMTALMVLSWIVSCRVEALFLEFANDGVTDTGAKLDSWQRMVEELWGRAGTRHE